VTEECTAIAVCVFVGNNPMTWSATAYDFGADEERAAQERASTEHARRDCTVIVARRFTWRIGTTRHSEWRVGKQVIVESDDFDVR
jgi:hypothetical protein